MGSTWHRPLGALALLLSLGSLHACTPPPASPPRTPAPALGPATYAFFFEYEPLLTLGLLRDGVPYEGVANLHISSGRAPPGPTAEPDEPQEGLLLVEAPFELTFRQGKAQLPPERLEALGEAPSLQLQVGTFFVDIPRSRGANPFRCGTSIHNLQHLDECTTPLPDEELVPDDCDRQGARIWQDRVAKKTELAHACFPDLSAKSLDKLAQAPHLQPRVCPGLVDKAGPDPGDETLSRLSKACLARLPPALQKRAVRLQASLDLPQALELARNGDTNRMRQFFHKYRESAPVEAEEIRKLAIKRFGPQDPALWFKVRKALESYRVSKRHYTLCEITERVVFISWAWELTLRFTDAREFLEEEQQPLVRTFVVDGPPARRSVNFPPAQEIRALEAVLLRHLKTSRRIVLGTECTQGRHWYFSTQEEPAP